MWPPAKKLLTHKGVVDVGTTGDHTGSPLQSFANPFVNNHLYSYLHFTQTPPRMWGCFVLSETSCLGVEALVRRVTHGEGLAGQRAVKNDGGEELFLFHAVK